MVESVSETPVEGSVKDLRSSSFSDSLRNVYTPPLKSKVDHISRIRDRDVTYFYRTLECTSPDQREYYTDT